MSDQYSTTPPTLSITAGTAFKFGFFGALGLFVFYLILSVILVVVGVILLAAGLNLPNLPGF